MIGKTDKQVAKSTGGGRIHYLDALKCFGIVLVIEGHVRLMGMGVETYDTLSGLMFYSFNMPLFFFVSGFLAYKAQQATFKEVMLKIWMKFICLVIPALIFYLFRSFQSNGTPLDLFTKGIGGYWFTITLWECFVVYYVVALMLSSKGKLQDATLIGLSLFGIVFLSVASESGPKLLDLNRFAKYFQFFSMGIIAMKYRDSYESIVRNDLIKSLVLISFFALLFTVNSEIWPKPVFHLLRDIILRYLGTFVVISWFVCHLEMFDVDTKINKVILDIGKKSLAIYLLQYFFIPDFNAYTLWLGGMDSVMMHVVSFTCTAFILVVCYGFISLLSNSILIKKYVLGQK